jgi:flagellar biosynthetic protein FliO
MTLLLALSQATELSYGLDAGLIRAFVGLFIVLGIIVLLTWLLRRGVISLPGHQARGPLAVQHTLQLGERRSLAIVSVDGRRLLIGVTASQVNLLAELGDQAPSFGRALDRQSTGAAPGTS